MTIPKKLVGIAVVSTLMWMVYLSMMIYEHRKVLQEMGRV